MSVDSTSELRHLLTPVLADRRSVPVRLPADGRAHPVVFDSVDYLGSPTSVFSYMAVPVASTDIVPAIALVHGGEGRAFAEWAELWARRGYLAIAMDLGGHRANGSRDARSGPDHDDATKFTSLGDGVANSWMLHAVAAVLGAIGILESLPQVDPRQIFLTGISWGAHVAEISAALHPRLAGACFVYGGGFIDENPVLGKHLADISVVDRQRWISEFDPRNYISEITVPSLWISGADDEYYPIGLFERSLELAAGPISIRITPEMPHGHEDGWAPTEILAFFEDLRGSDAGLPRITPITVHGGEARSTIDRTVSSAALWVTRDDGAWADRTWESTPAMIEGFVVSAGIPGDVHAGFFLVTDADGNRASSRIEFL